MNRPSAREKVLTAATQVFCDKGYSAATTKEISEAAGIAEVTLFRNFNSKKELFVAVISQLKEPLSGFVERFCTVVDDGRLLEEFLIERLVTTSNTEKLFLLHLYEMQFHEDIKQEFAAIQQEFLKVLSSYLQRNFKLGLKVGDLAAKYFLAVVIGNTVMMQVLHKKKASHDDCKEIVKMFIHSLKSQEGF